MKKITMPKMFDAHFHFRQGEILELMLRAILVYCFGAMAVTNTEPPVIDAEGAERYKEPIKKIAPNFHTVMSMMLVKNMTTEMIREAFKKAAVSVLKLIPTGTSTNSENGVRLQDLESYYPHLKLLRELGMIFSIHLELTYSEMEGDIPLLKREEAAIYFLEKLIKDIPKLKIVVEHVSTKKLAEFIIRAPENVAATITPQHLILESTDVINLLTNKIINPFLYCKPIAKSPDDRKAVIDAMVSGNPKFFAGTDNAPWPRWKKINPNEEPAAGICSVKTAPSIYLEKFEEQGELKRAPDFICNFGPAFYGFAPSEEMITFIKDLWVAPISIGDIELLRGGSILNWQLKKQ